MTLPANRDSSETRIKDPPGRKLRCFGQLLQKRRDYRTALQGKTRGSRPRGPTLSSARRALVCHRQFAGTDASSEYVGIPCGATEDLNPLLSRRSWHRRRSSASTGLFPVPITGHLIRRFFSTNRIGHRKIVKTVLT